MTIIGQVTPIYFTDKSFEDTEISQKYVPYQVGKYEKSFTLLKMAMTRLTSSITISLALDFFFAASPVKQSWMGFHKLRKQHEGFFKKDTQK